MGVTNSQTELVISYQNCNPQSSSGPYPHKPQLYRYFKVYIDLEYTVSNNVIAKIITLSACFAKMFLYLKWSSFWTLGVVVTPQKYIYHFKFRVRQAYSLLSCQFYSTQYTRGVSFKQYFQCAKISLTQTNLTSFCIQP